MKYYTRPLCCLAATGQCYSSDIIAASSPLHKNLSNITGHIARSWDWCLTANISVPECQALFGINIILSDNCYFASLLRIQRKSTQNTTSFRFLSLLIDSVASDSVHCLTWIIICSCECVFEASDLSTFLSSSC